MDDSSSPSIGLDLNPDMMTTQTGVPTVIPKSIPFPSSEVIDITPGILQTPLYSAPFQHIDIATLPENKIVDITPDGPISKELLSDENLNTTYPLGEIVVSPTVNFPQGMTSVPSLVEIKSPIVQPQIPVSAVIANPELISDILHEVSPVLDITPADLPQTILTETLTETPVPEPIANPKDSISEPPIIASAQTEATPTAEELAKLNPLYEDPDVVKINR